MILDHMELNALIQTIDLQRKSHRYVLIGLKELWKKTELKIKYKDEKRILNINGLLRVLFFDPFDGIGQHIAGFVFVKEFNFIGSGI